MKVFISWSGEGSRKVAEALHTWLPKVIQAVAKDLWVSYEMEKGSNWVVELNKGLEQTRFAVLCMTAENLDSAWVLYEAGALSMAQSINQKQYVCPYLFGIKSGDLPKPLGQFQTATTNKEGTFGLVRSINNVQEHPLPEPMLREEFEHRWPALEEDLKKIPKPRKCIKLEYEKIKALVEVHQEAVLYKMIHQLLEDVIRTVAEGREPNYSAVSSRLYGELQKNRELYRGLCTERTRKDLWEFFEENYNRDELKADIQTFTETMRFEEAEDIEMQRKKVIHCAEAIVRDVISRLLRKLNELER